MENYDIGEIETELECLSLQEKRERLKNVQNEIESKIEELEAAKDDVNDLLSDVEDHINDNYEAEIYTALKGISSDACKLLPDNTLDIEGLKFGFYRFCENDNTLNIYINGRMPIVNTGDFDAEFKAFLQPILPNAKYKDRQLSIRIDDNREVATLVKGIVEKLIAEAPKIVGLGGKYRFV
ncbi:MAG: hypothetical protein J5711_00160 [Bacteroidales bacterium]|nr:hypothetical protein [Bacteroidales bacterium]